MSRNKKIALAVAWLISNAAMAIAFVFYATHDETKAECLDSGGEWVKTGTIEVKAHDGKGGFYYFPVDASECEK